MEMRSRKSGSLSESNPYLIKKVTFEVSEQKYVQREKLFKLDLPLIFLLIVRLWSVLWNNISDCDETFNYWEPTHYMIYGYGFQTWEYSPTYAIRSYAYIWIQVLPGFIINIFLRPHKILVFYLIRSFLGLSCAFSEIYLYRSVCRRFGYDIGSLTLIFLLFGTGMFISSTSYLPSTFSMYFTMISFGAYFLKQYKIAIVSTAASSFIGWPFVAVLGLPIAFDIILLKKKLLFFIKWSTISLLFLLGPLVIIDSYFYGRLNIAPLNIVLYNVFSKHGPDLYGKEPWTFYFINGFLNFNIIFILAVISFLILIIYQFNFHLKDKEKKIQLWSCIFAMYLWIAIFFNQSHKEERFLYPIYPLICINAAIALKAVEKILSAISKNFLYLTLCKWMPSFVCIVFAILSLSRIFALYKGYSAPIEIYKQLNYLQTVPSDEKVNICIGKEWYRFPSNFFLPLNFRLQFLQSDFHGQLPKPFSDFSNATQIIPDDMNDENREELSRYINIKNCHYLIDSDFARTSSFEPRYSQDKDNWEVKFATSFLDTERSSRWFRAFYIPFIYDTHCSFVNYNLLKKVKSNK